MRVARWKVMAGGLLLSAGGLMAVADGTMPAPGCQPLPPCRPALPLPAVTRVSLEAPVVPAAPRPADLPPAVPGLPPLPGSPPAPVINNTPAPPLPSAAVEPTALPPSIPQVGAVPPNSTPGFNFTTTPDERVRVTETRSGLFTVTQNAAPAPAVPDPKKSDPTPAAAEKRVKVVLHMGDDRPRFEVRDGEETYLKVVSDRVEVKSAAAGEVPTMKAGGKVAFVTPGGDGTCDELTILPGSGQVIAAGNVAFRHTWGRSETTVSAERMTFRLSNPGPTAIQAGYTPVK